MLWSNLEEVGKLFEPWEEFERMRRAFFRASAPSNGEFPAVNVWSSADSALVTTELPGVDPGEIDISVSGNTLTVKGEREPETLADGESYHRRERWYGKFSKAIDLPFNVQAEKVHAKFVRGILSIDLPRAESERPKKIEITSY
jgi:HSP20 family protein